MSSLVAVPTRGLAKAADLVTREARDAALKAGSSAAYADKIGQLFQQWQTIEDAAKGNKTLTGAYVHRASADANGGVAESKVIAERMGVQTTARYGYYARLHFDFGFDPEDGTDWTLAIRYADKDKGFRELLNRETAEGEKPLQKQDLLDYIAKGEAEKDTAKGTRKNRPAAEKDDTAKGDDKGTVIASNSARNAAIAELLNQWQASDASAADVAGFLANMVRAQSMLRFIAADTMAEAKSLLAKDDTATPATVAKRKGTTSATSAK